MKKTLAVTIALMIAIVGVFVSQALAEEEESFDDFMLEEVVVTAQKREENLQDVPISITALSERRLEQLIAKDISDVEHFAPNLSFSNTFSNWNPAIRVRGINTSANNVGWESGFGVYIDGVYIGRSAALLQSLADVERIEVLRGPQGTLFGKNTTVGAFNVTTHRPGKEFEGLVRLEVGNYNLIRTRANISGPLVDGKLFGKISFASDNRDGFYETIQPGAHDAVDEDQLSTRGELRYTPTDVLDIALRWDWMDSDGYVISYQLAENPPFVISQDDIVEERTMKGASLTVDYDFGDGYTVTSISAFRALELSFAGDLDGGPLPTFVMDRSSEFDQFTQELRIASPAGRKFEYVAGLYYFNQTAKEDLADSVPLLVGAAPFWPDLESLTMRKFPEVDTWSAAVFFDGRYAFTDDLRLLFGARFTHEEKELTMSQKGVIGFGRPDVAPFTDDRDDQELSPSIGLSYAANDDVTLYTKVSRGFKSGGWNASDLTTSPPDLSAITFDPEHLTSYELGMKSEFFDHRIRLNAAAFYIDYEDMQIRVYRGIEGDITTNAGKARSQGFEIEVDAMPTGHLQIFAGVGYSDAEYAEFDPNDTVPGNENGTRMPGSIWSANLGLTYTYPVSFGDTFGDIVGGLDFSYKSKAYPYFNNDTSKFGSIEVVNARLGLSSLGAWDIFVWGKNIL
ncbi:MAG: TonB-dependent receptor, partial [Deltaproteobacteria bacterium]|nr:TonB-dependent receptor [Deltaproteobacteria bacterium]